MAKSFCYHKPYLIIIIFLFALVSSVTQTYARSNEFELFDSAYENYLSYKPEKAVEGFTLFTREFSDSSANDAALFWLGKAFAQLQLNEESRKAFTEIKEKYPQSPFIPFVNSELEELQKSAGVVSPVKEIPINRPEKGNETEDIICKEINEKAEISEKKLLQAVEEQKRLNILIKDWAEKYESLQQRMESNEKLLIGLRDEKAELQRRLDEETKRNKDLNKQLINIKEKEDLAKKVASELNEVKKKLKEKEKDSENLREKISLLEQKRDSINKLLEEEKRKNEQTVSALNNCSEERNELKKQTDAKDKNINKIEGITSLLEEEKIKSGALQAKLDKYEYRESYVKQSFIVLRTLGIHDLVWRTGNSFEDMDNEQLLYEKAKSLGIAIDTEQYRDLMEKHTFNQLQSDYLNKFLIMSELIDLRLKEMPEERMVEILMVEFGDNKFDKTALAAKLQTDARKGISFFEISRTYPDKVHYSETVFDSLQDWIKKKVKQLQNGQIGVIWSEGGYLIIKSKMKKLTYSPFQKISPEIKEKIRNYVRQWLDEYREQVK